MNKLRWFFVLVYLSWLNFSYLSVAPGDYGNLTNCRLGPFGDTVRQLSFNVSIVNDNILEDVEMFNVSLTLGPADRARLGNRVTVSPDVATITIQDNDGKHTYFNIKSVLSNNTHIFIYYSNNSDTHVNLLCM